jgi:hypothetical protein
MSYCISVNISTAAMEDIYERLCWLYIAVHIMQNTLIYDLDGNTHAFQI